MTSKRKAVALISGGLDSMLAARLMLDQDIHVEGINFYTGFCVEGHTHAIRSKNRDKPKRNNALWVAEKLGIKLHLVDVIEEYKDIVINPKHGYGANLNPCLDCKGFMVKKAYQWLQENNFDFIITGEVIGQRPMSQRRSTMPVVARESGANALLLRPLCAHLLPMTYPEEQGWADRDKLLGLSGRNRKPQIALAKQYNLDDFAQPAGGCCFLTNEHYAAKLKDLWASRGEKHYELDDIMLLKVGRHLRPRPHFKLIIGREEGENRYLEGYRSQYTHLKPLSHTGPLALIDGIPDDDDLLLAARLVARYSHGRDADHVRVEIAAGSSQARTLDVKPLADKDIPQAWRI